MPTISAAKAPSAIYRLVWQAVRERQRIVFEYDGRRREACPIILGYSDNGREAVKAYQVGGATSKGPLPAWRDFYLDGVRALRVSDGPWLEGSSHKQAQAFVKLVDVDANIPETLSRPGPLPFGSPLLGPPRQPNK